MTNEWDWKKRRYRLDEVNVIDNIFLLHKKCKVGWMEIFDYERVPDYCARCKTPLPEQFKNRLKLEIVNYKYNIK